MCKPRLSGCAVLHASKFWAWSWSRRDADYQVCICINRILLIKGRGKPPWSQQFCFWNHSCGIGKPPSIPGAGSQSHMDSGSQSHRGGRLMGCSELKINLISTFLTLIFSHFGTNSGSHLSSETFPSCNLLSYCMKHLRSEEKDRESPSSSPQLQRTASKLEQ